MTQDLRRALSSFAGTDPLTNLVTVNLPASMVCQYDGNGNLTNDGLRGFEYDDENQLVAVTVAGVWRSEFVYDGKMRRRVRKEYTWTGGSWAQTNEVRYVYDGNLVLQERSFAPQLSTNQPQQLVTYTRGHDLSGTREGAGGIGGLLARSEISNLKWSHSFYHADGNGNVTALVGTNSTLVARYLYDPYGNILAQSGPLADANLYRFSSKEWHPNSGLIYYLYRYYKPAMQRWVNRDPIGELSSEPIWRIRFGTSPKNDINLYRFVQNGPTIFVDPKGLFGGPAMDNWGKQMCESRGGKWETKAQHDYGGDVSKCADDIICSSRLGSFALGMGMTAGGVVGNRVAGDKGAIYGAAIGGGVASAAAYLICNTPTCYDE